MMPTHYEVLGVPRGASAVEINSAFRRLALLYHPDKAHKDPTSNAKFIRIREAQEVLCDPVRRGRYASQIFASTSSTFTYREPASAPSDRRWPATPTFSETASTPWDRRWPRTPPDHIFTRLSRVGQPPRCAPRFHSEYWEWRAGCQAPEISGEQFLWHVNERWNDLSIIQSTSDRNFEDLKEVLTDDEFSILDNYCTIKERLEALRCKLSKIREDLEDRKPLQ